MGASLLALAKSIYYFAAMRIVIYEIMMYFQHKINVLVLYPLRETTNKKYLFMYFHILV